MFDTESKMNRDRRNSYNTEVDHSTVDVTESSSSDASPASMVPNIGDLTLEKDTDRKALKQDLYDLRLRIYYMEQREKMMKGEDGDDIYQKYMDLLTEHEKLTKNVDEKDDLLLKAQKVTSYLREEKEKLLFEFQEKEKFYEEHVQQLEKKLEEMKLCNPKFGLHSTAFMSSGDNGDSFAFPVNKDQKRCNELEHQIFELNMELESLKASNDQLEQTVHSLQRKVNICNKEIADLNKELIVVQKERDVAIENCAKNNELLNRVEEEKEKLEFKLAKVEEDNNERVSSSGYSADQLADESSQSLTSNGSGKKSDTAAAAVIRHLLTENKQMNTKLRKLKEDLEFTYKMCAGCANCLKEKKLKKSSVLSLRQKSSASTSEDEKSHAASLRINSESELSIDNACKFNIVLLLKEKDKQIKELEVECRKFKYHLQELVNIELWSKNREIEKLNKLCRKQKLEIESFQNESDHASTHLESDHASTHLESDHASTHLESDHASTQLESDHASTHLESDHASTHLAMREILQISMRKYNNEDKENISCLSDDVKMLREQLRLYLEEKKILLNKIYELEKKITSEEEQKAHSSLVHNLRLEVAKHRDEFEEAEKARKDAFNACAMLTNRLEELATFLESLLTHDTAGLNSRKRELLKQAIDRSREISKSFSSTFADPENASIAGTKFESSVDLSAPILPDYSEINLSFSCGDEDEDDVGNHTLKPSDEDNRNSVFNLMMRRSNASTENLDSYLPKNTVLFVEDLKASGELIFSSEGVHQLDDNINEDDGVGEQKCSCCPNSVTTSSMPASTDEAPKITEFDSESESWSEPERQAQFDLTSSGSKLRNRKLKPEPCYSTDSDVPIKRGKTQTNMNEMRLMQRRIMNLERINESLRKELKCLRSCSKKKKIPPEKTDMEKLCEKTKMRNLLNKINLENCIDTDKYRDYVELVRRHLRDLSKYLLKSKKLDKSFISALLREVFEYFEMSDLCCSKLGHHLEEMKTRCDLLTGLLEETQSKFEQVMVDLRTTKLAYNNIILEHEQSEIKYKQSELANEQLNERLKSECEALKKQHEQKMKQLLAQIVAYRTEEESNLVIQRQLVEQIEEVQQKKEVWKKSIADWKEKYDELKKEKELIEEQLQSCKVRSSESHVKDGANKSNVNTDAEVHHLENIKLQLETRVRELEVANKQLESCLQCLQTNKVSPSYFDLTSSESSRTGSPTSKKNFPFDFDYSTSKSGTTTTGYSSSLPSSPNHNKRPPSPLASSMPHSPVSASEENYFVQGLWVASGNSCKAPRRSIYDDVFNSKSDNRVLTTSVRKNSCENSATSPDLGIDSDHGRNSSFDFDTGNIEGTKIRTEIVKLEEENKTLKQELGQTRKELEETLGKLTMLNKNKRQMEKAIYKQVYETRHIIQKARGNLEDDTMDRNSNAS